MFTIQINGQNYPCPDVSTLQTWLAEGRIAKESRIYDSRSEQWCTVAEILGLSSRDSREPPLTPKRMSISKKKRIQVAVVGAVVLAAIGLGFRYIQATPQYAFYKIKAAVGAHDRAMFYEYVDVDSLVKRTVDVLLARSTNSGNNNDSDEWSKAGSQIASGFMELIKPKLIEIVKDQIDKLIEQSDSTGNTSNPSVEKQSTPSGWDLNLKAMEITGIQDVQKQGKITLVTMSGRQSNYDASFPIRFKFRLVEGNHLQLVELENLAEILDSLDSAEKAWKLAQNKPVREKLSTLIKLNNLRKNNTTDRWGFDRTVRVAFNVQNLSENAITGFLVKIHVRYGDNKTYSLDNIDFAGEPIASGESMPASIQYDINPFITEQKLLWDTDVSDATATAKFIRVKFASGEELALPYPEVEPL